MSNLDMTMRMVQLGGALFTLRPGMKQPAREGWQTAAVMTPTEAANHADGGGNLGLHLGRSNMVAFDSEDLLATTALLEAGFVPTVIPAKAQYTGVLKPGLDDPSSGKENAKVGGSHVWLRVPDTIDASQLSTDHSMQLTLPNGGLIDVLAGPKYVVAPPSALELTYGMRYAASQGGPLDLSLGAAAPDIAEAPMWLFDLSVPCPPGLAPLHGCLIPRVREHAEQSARSAELSAQIDEVPWDEWLAGEHRLTPTGEVDGCGCDIYYWQGSSNTKSCTLHDGCEQGNGVHIWSGTMIGHLGLTQHHLSRLDLAVALRGESRQTVAASVGIQLGGEREELTATTPEFYERAAAHFDELGDSARADLYREAAAVMRRTDPTPPPEARGETFISEPMVGAESLTATPVTPEEPARMATVTPLFPHGVVPPVFTSAPTPAGAGAGAPPPIFNVGASAQAAAGPVPPTVGATALQPEPAPAQPDPKPKRKSDWRDEVAPLEEKLFTMLPCTRHVAATADALGSGRQGVLAVTLSRVSAVTGPHVRLLTAAGMRGTARQGGSLNMFVGLVGKPNAGKTEAMDAGEYLVPIPDSMLIPEGTGEGIVKSFGFMRREKHGKGEDAFYTYEFEKLAEQCFLVADEVDNVFAEMTRQGSKFAPMWRSMWMGTMVGTTTGELDRRTRLLSHTYRLAVLLGCQPEATVPLWAEGNRGTPQRIHWAPCTRRKPNGLPVPEPLKLAYQEEPRPEIVGLPTGYHPPAAGDTAPDEIRTIPEWRRDDTERQPRWIEWPPAARAFIEAELEELEEDDDPYGEGDDDEEDEVLKLLGHATFMRLKIMALLAIMDGLEQPTDRHWEAAGIAMQLREMCMRRTMARSTRVGKVVAETKGVEQGIQQATAARTKDAVAAEFDMELGVKIITLIAQLGDKATSAAIRRLANKRQKDHVPGKLEKMVAAGNLGRDVKGVYTVVRMP